VNVEKRVEEEELQPQKVTKYTKKRRLYYHESPRAA